MVSQTTVIIIIVANLIIIPTVIFIKLRLGRKKP